MVVVADKKYACETCIKGHRSSTCKHTDRPLYEIKKKGRPVTQCQHCRELRKTKQVHVKCMCGSTPLKDLSPESDAPSPPSGSAATPVGFFKKKGGKKVPASAAFPSGLPQTMGTSVVLSEGSDSEQALELHSSTCTCDANGICNCTTPRIPVVRAKRRLSKTAKQDSTEPEADGELRMSNPGALAANANIVGKRPILPRPSDRSSPPRATHSASGPSHGARTHVSSFSPYERAYEYAHGAEVGPELAASLYAAAQPQSTSAPLSTGLQDIPFPAAPIPQREDNEDISEVMANWLATLQAQNIQAPMSCDCGPSCACAGCAVHQASPSVPQSGQVCVNPSTCGSCLDCIVTSMTPDNPAVEDWLRRLPSLPQSSTTGIQPLVPNYASSQHQANNFDPSMWQTYALWPNLHNQIPAPPPAEDATTACCGGQCKCSAGACSCPADCCGCCSGCSCSGCEHEDRTMGTGKTLTFAVSGERGACCSGSARAQGHSSSPYGQQSQPGPSNSAGRSLHNLDSQVAFDFTGQQLDLRGAYDWGVSELSTEMPRVSLSRASSSSSRPSSRGSHSSHGSPRYGSASPNPVGVSNGPDNAAVRSCCTSLETMGTLSAGSSVPSSHANSPIPPSFSPSPILGQIPDHRTFTSSSSSTTRAHPADFSGRTFL